MLCSIPRVRPSRPSGAFPEWRTGSAPPPSPGRPRPWGERGQGRGGSGREPGAEGPEQGPSAARGSHAARPTFGLTSARARLAAPRHGRRRCRGDGPRYRDSGSARPGRLSPQGATFEPQSRLCAFGVELNNAVTRVTLQQRLKENHRTVFSVNFGRYGLNLPLAVGGYRKTALISKG